MDRMRSCKPILEKENQQKFVNKKTDLLSSLNHIKLPLQLHRSHSNKFHSVPNIASILDQTDEKIVSLVSAREPQPKKQALREKSATEDYCEVYGQQIEALFSEEEKKGKFMFKHKIDGALRARMLDWMVEVMCSYNFQHKTYFAGVQIMDRFFADSEEVLAPNQLHIIGVQSMFVATKMEEVYPLKMKTIYDKIAHKKIPIVDLVSMEQKILETLGFKLNSSTFYDLAMTRLARHLDRTESYSPELLKQLEEICAYLGKLIIYNYNLLCVWEKDCLANALFALTLSVQKVDGPVLKNKDEQCMKMVLESIKGFKRQFKSLNNLGRFTNKELRERIQEALF